MKTWLVIGLVLIGSVAEAQAPASLQKALQEAQANLAKRAAALQASDVLKDYEAAKAHVETLTALIKAEAAKATEHSSK